MYEKFTDRARKVFQLANQQAQRLNHDYLDTDHVLLGIAQDENCLACLYLRYRAGLDPRKIELEVKRRQADEPSAGGTLGKLPQRPRLKKSVEKAMEFSRDLCGGGYVGTEHILLGILCSGGKAQDVLTSLGVNIQDLKEWCHSAHGEESLPPELSDIALSITLSSCEAMAQAASEIRRLQEENTVLRDRLNAISQLSSLDSKQEPTG